MHDLRAKQETMSGQPTAPWRIVTKLTEHNSLQQCQVIHLGTVAMNYKFRNEEERNQHSAAQRDGRNCPIECF